MLNLLENCYEILDLDKNASQDEIKKRFRELTLEHHPDKSKSEDAHNNFLKIKYAYDVLSDTKKRRIHDIQIYGTDESYSNASGRRKDDLKRYAEDYGDSRQYEFEELYEQIFQSTKLHLTSLMTAVGNLAGKLQDGMELKKFSSNMLDWYHGIDIELFAHCNRISMLFPNTHDVLLEEIKKIQNEYENYVEITISGVEERFLNIKKHGSLLYPHKISKYSRTTNYAEKEIQMFEEFVKTQTDYFSAAVNNLNSLQSSPNGEKLGLLVTKTINYPKIMQIIVSFIDTLIDNLELKFYQKRDLENKLKQHDETKTITFAGDI